MTTAGTQTASKPFSKGLAGSSCGRRNKGALRSLLKHFLGREAKHSGSFLFILPSSDLHLAPSHFPKIGEPRVSTRVHAVGTRAFRPMNWTHTQEGCSPQLSPPPVRGDGAAARSQGSPCVNAPCVCHRGAPQADPWGLSHLLRGHTTSEWRMGAISG